MKIAFLTGELEPGKSGVGDYTHLLASECERLGTPVCLIAIADPNVTGEVRGNLDGLPALRLGADTSWDDKARSVREFLRKQEATHVSLQFVAYAYNPRGIASGIARRFQSLFGTLPVHIMFHELWRGSYLNAPLKERVIGWLQRRSLLSMIRQLRPKVVHTSNPAYATLLRRQRVDASVLPLFGHVPIPENTHYDWLFKELQNCGIEIDERNRSEFWIFGMFGTLHPVWQPEPFLPLVISAAQKHGKKPVLVSSGRIGAAGEDLWRGMASRYAGGCAFCQIRERSPEQLGQFFQFIDFGVAATPWAIIGKSSATASMTAHGVPVIVTRDELGFPFPVENDELSPLLVKLTPQIGEQLSKLKRGEPFLSSQVIADRFLTEFVTPAVGRPLRLA